MKKKVVFCMKSLAGGGAEKVLVDILNSINKEKFDITLLLINNNGVHIKNLDEKIKLKGIYKINSNKYINRIKEIFLYKILLTYFPKLIHKIYINDKYDVEVAFLEGWPTQIIANSQNKKSKKIAWIHTDLNRLHYTKKIFKNKINEKNVYKKFQKLIFVSKDSLNGFEKLFGENDISKEVIYNIVDKNKIEFMGEESNIEINKFDFNVISCGRLVREKGFDKLIKIHSELVKFREHKLIILGDGIEKNNLKKIAIDNGVENTVKFLGFRKNPYKYIKNSDLFISSSSVEGYPLVIIEAMALKTPIIATDISGSREALNYGEFGELCCNDSDGIKNLYKKALLDKEFLFELKEKAIVGAENLDEKILLKKIEDILLDN
ncbi:glycosyltransferase [Clostridium perfringens]|uniref:glycosyltransferase n=1 Tax=Clostridium perfringens TaxID=1502 RepID=UPI003F9217CD